MERLIENNQAVIAGNIISEFSYSHEVLGEKFYSSYVEVERLSGVMDILPVVASESLINPDETYLCKCVHISGQLRSYNKVDNAGKRHLQLSVFAKELDVLESKESEISCNFNYIFLDGYVCKQPTFRNTPYGRDITDLMIGVNRMYGRSDYLPCIVWGRRARWAKNLEVGAHIKLKGRMQSRMYRKKLSDDLEELRTAYEVSISFIERVDDQEE